MGCDCECEFEGPRCETRKNFCKVNNCKNGGVCVETKCDSKCECPCGTTGEFCDVLINACIEGLVESGQNNKCNNGGRCIDNRCNFTCECTAGFTGDVCQIPKNTCNPNNCQNGGECVSYKDDYLCKCPCARYSGKNCEVRNVFNQFYV